MNTYSPSEEQMAYKKQTKRVEELKGFYGNLISYCILFRFILHQLENFSGILLGILVVNVRVGELVWHTRFSSLRNWERLGRKTNPKIPRKRRKRR